MRIEFFMPMKPPTVTHQEKEMAGGQGQAGTLRAAGGTGGTVEADSAPGWTQARGAPGRRGAAAGEVVLPRGQHEDGEYRTTRPDTDNLQKLLKDCMTAVGF